MFRRISEAYNTLTGKTGKDDLARKETDTRDLKKISDWIYKTAKEIDSKAPDLQSKTENDGLFAKYLTFKMHREISIEQFNKGELKTLQPALCELHNICRKHNIAIDLQGFDLLPRTTLATEAYLDLSPYSSSSLLIAIDGRRTYNHWINPFSEQELDEARQKYKAPPPSPKQ